MVRLKRITNKIFGETASTVGSEETGAEIGQFGSAKLGTYNATNNVEEIQGLDAYNKGWIGGVIPNQQYPTLPEMTGVNKVLSYQTGYLMQEGIPEWDKDTTYYKNSIVKAQKVTYTRKATASIGSSTGIKSASVDENTIFSKIMTDGTFEIVYIGNQWTYRFTNIDLSYYGISYTGTPVENDKIIIKLTTSIDISEANLYISNTNDNKGNEPTADEVNWKLYSSGANKDLSNISKAGKEVISNLPMPSDKYIDLPLKPPKELYDAPADGYFSLVKYSNGNNQFISGYGLKDGATELNNSTIEYGTVQWVPLSNNGNGFTLPVKKGRKIGIDYTMGGPVVFFRFVYAQGEI